MPNGAHKTPQFALRVDPRLMEKLKYVAKYNGRSANKEIEQLIQKHVTAYEKAHGEITIK